MTYLATTLIAFLFYFLELSLLPHFSPWLTIPFFVLPFIAILSARDRTIFPIILGGILGLMLDAATLNNLPVFAITFVAITAVSKLFFAQFVSYGEIRATFFLTSLGLVLVYGLEVPVLIKGISWSMGWLAPIILNFILTYLVLGLMLYYLRSYFDWIEKTTEGRHR